MSALELAAPPAIAGRPAPTLAEVIVRALRVPGVVPCPVCAGRLAPTRRGAACRDCGSAIEREPPGTGSGIRPGRGKIAVQARQSRAGFGRLEESPDTAEQGAG